mmetsp:Transcript_6907/g.14663  ORF Transcript_6907/g.14663 Transcript_6907/m.14663 type:complete len:318 (-) Transcript_6907:201-1154(-)
MSDENYDYQRIHGTAAPESMSMNRLEELDELVVAQTTQVCLRHGCCTPSINWVLLDSSNYELPDASGGSSFADFPSVGGWIHEESTFFQRCCFSYQACRETKFVHHAGLPPASLGIDDREFCRIQESPATSFLTEEELKRDIIATHEKAVTCPTNCWCCPNHLPYLRTLDSEGRYLGETKYVCDACPFVPKFLVLDKHRTPKYLLRPDTCWMGLCIRPTCGGQGGKCCRLPFVLRDPDTLVPLAATLARDGEEQAQVTQLWTGLANEVCFQRNAYHVAFPPRSTSASTLSCSVEDKLVLIGSSILIDVGLFENDNEK